MKKLFRKWAIKQNEEKMLATENIGAVLFIIGLFAICIMADVIPMLIWFMVFIAGFVMVAISESAIAEMYKDEFSDL